MTGKFSVACLLGLAAERCRAARRRQGKTDAEIAKFSKLFTEVQQQIDSKQLRPMIRTQYLRTAFQVWVWGAQTRSVKGNVEGQVHRPPVQACV